MKVLVTAKRVIDPVMRIQVRSDGSGIETTGARMIINPFDQIALEEALRLKEKGQASEVVLVTIGPSVSQDILRTGLAMGADRAILIESNDRLEQLAVAKLLRAVAEQEQPGLVLMGKQSIDSDASQTGSMLAALLNWPQATFISELTLASGRAVAVREVDAGLQTLDLPLPAVITTDLRLNEPRFASLPNIMKARSKPLAVVPADSFGVELSSRLKVLSTREPPRRQRGTMLETAGELAGVLKTQLNRG
ncbi:electron transfer flavoprotein subunit beta/FixA family protein [Devosia sp.]|uniref:electron transfer flavoprotein subunit beta/FixA family protein n=1 Tax=Devosia sp. TaxID=1871048 RepID=UPI0025FBBE07|nr:electron transfer flavoprotein subunit beta/FixA family protein [Devosia sp.]MCR6633578.1 electron transfer flavoprotein subunit beta/FixA family protein [Devosia sp.]